jgi:hypothetical protein
MADPIFPSAPTLERQAIEVIYALKNAERIYNIDHPNAPVNNVSLAIDPLGRAIYLSVKIEAEFSFEGGQMVMRGSEYIPSNGGSGS